MHVSSQCCLPHLECQDSSEQSDLDDTEDIMLIMNSYHSQSHSLEKAKET